LSKKLIPIPTDVKKSIPLGSNHLCLCCPLVIFRIYRATGETKSQKLVFWSSDNPDRNCKFEKPYFNKGSLNLVALLPTPEATLMMLLLCFPLFAFGLSAKLMPKVLELLFEPPTHPPPPPLLIFSFNGFP
jgi:hypothetical protein